jgi:hypothetical protein
MSGTLWGFRMPLIWSTALGAALLAFAPVAQAQQGGLGGVGGQGGVGALGGAGGLGPGGNGGQGGAATDGDSDGYSVAQGDCDDSNPAVHPGATELCNGIDDDCDGDTDENLMVTQYRDYDGDGWGDSADTVVACPGLSNYVTQGGDCDDWNGGTYPGAYESSSECVDSNCDGEVSSDCHAGSGGTGGTGGTGGYAGNGGEPCYRSGGLTFTSDLVSGGLLTVWLGLGAWRRRRKLGS